MKMKIKIMLIGISLLLVSVSVVQAATIEIVDVGNTGNGNAWISGGPLGAVDYEYRMGKYEVTAAQYTEFLNAVADTDAYDLYHTSMAGTTFGCGITQSGASGSYSYSVNSSFATRPAVYVNWGSAARFANWLHNGQPTGVQDATTTEDGAYYLNGATNVTALMAVSRESDWKWALPTDSEWFKTGYHKNDGDTPNYFIFPTSSDTAPGMAKNLTNFPDGPLEDPGNYANYGGVYDEVTRHTHVGDLEDSASPYGTFDQCGNAKEWTEGKGASDTQRSSLGGNFNDSSNYELSKIKRTTDPTTALWGLGFRVVTGPPAGTLIVIK